MWTKKRLEICFLLSEFNYWSMIIRYKSINNQKTIRGGGRILKFIKQYLYELGISARIRLVFLPILIGSILVITMLANSISKEIVIKGATLDVVKDLKLIETNIRSLTNEAESSANSIIININGDVKFDRVDPSTIKDISDVKTSLLEAKILFSRVEDSTFVDSDGAYITSIISRNVFTVGNIKDTQFFKLITQIDNTGGWILDSSNKVLTSDKEDFRLTYVKSIRNLNNASDIGYAVVNVNEHTLYDVYKSISTSREITYRIVDENNQILSSVNRDEVGEVYDFDELSKSRSNTPNAYIVDGKETLVNQVSVQGTPWKVISMITLDELTKEVDRMTKTLFAFGAVVILLAFLSTLRLSDTITEPIIKLSRHMKNLKDGTLSKYEAEMRGDEIGALNISFNKMIDRNDSLQKQRDENEKKKREYELALLQSQIKPHFLYNTLDIINRLAALDRKKEVIKATKNIADFYRIALSKGDEIISIGREVELIEKYLYIQLIRYPDLCEFKMLLDDQILKHTIPKFTLQPLIENAIYHGLKEKDDDGIIVITGHIEEDCVILEVKDNGVGMTREKVDSILRRSSERSMNKPYGVYNSDERLKLYYGDDFGVTISSEVGIGTTIKLRVGINYKENIDV